MQRIGIDLDNTIADFRGIFRQLADEFQIVDAAAVLSRQAIRAAARASPGGEACWQRMQALAYGPRMPEAALFPGFLDFVAAARAAGHALFIVSHRSQYAAADAGPDRVSLHDSAAAWLGDAGIAADAVYFETTRAAKIARIAALGLDAFIDDLPEVLADPAFPAGPRRFLFQPDSPEHDWPALRRSLLDRQ